MKELILEPTIEVQSGLPVDDKNLCQQDINTTNEGTFKEDRNREEIDDQRLTDDVGKESAKSESDDIDHSQHNEPDDQARKVNLIRSEIKSLTGDIPQDLQTIREKIVPLIVHLDGALPEYFVDELKRKTGLSKAAIREELKIAQSKIEMEGFQGVQTTAPEPDPEVLEMVEGLKRDPLLFKRRIDAVNQLGLAGERKTIGQIYMVLDSSLLLKSSAGSGALAAKISGPFGTGKSRAIFSCLKLYPKERYHQITSGSSKSLYNIPGGLKHKVLVLVEAFVLDREAGGDSELTYAVRSLISEGDLVYQYTSFDDEKRKVTVTVKMEGPTSLLTTTIRGRLEPQLEDRLITIVPDTSREQTRDILMISAQEASGNQSGLNEKTVEAWVHFHKSLEPCDVVIPFAKELGDYVTSNQNLPLGTRRAFVRVLSAIKTIALFHQHQRARDDQNRLIAEISDYFIAYQLIDDSFRESLGEGKSLTDPRVRVIENLGPISMKNLAKAEKVSVPSVTEWVNLRVPRGLIVWCDAKGKEFPDKVELDKAKHSGKAFIKVGYPCGLPTPYQLTHDANWNEAGELYEAFNLGLDDRKKTVGNCDAASREEDLTDVIEPDSEPLQTMGGDTASGVRGTGMDHGGVEKIIELEEPATAFPSAEHNEEEILFNQFSGILEQPGIN